MDELQTSHFFVNLLLLSFTKRLASFKSSLLLKVIKTKQRSLALFIPKESSNAEKRNVINYHGMLISEVIFCIQFIRTSLLQYIMNEWAEC